MTCDSGTAKALVENLLNDLRLLSSEAKKYGQVRESCETAIMKLRGVSATLSTDKLSNHRIFSGISVDLIQPFSLALKSKQPKSVQIALTALQRLISHEIFDVNLARYLVDDLWILMENEIEELRILQTMTLLGNYSSYVTGEVLAKSLVICFRLNFAKDPLVINTASATVRQLVAQVYERCSQQNGVVKNHGIVAQKVLGRNAPTTLSSTEADAFMLFQDLCRLVNAEPPYWLLGITEMTRTLGLDLLDSILMQNPDVFSQKPEFIFILKELVCPLVVKLFSPNLKYGQKQLHGQLMAGPNSTENVSSRAMDKPYFPIVLRLNRLVLTLILRYHRVLSTECEIFLSLLLKFLDQDKIDWYRALAIETVYKIVKKKELLKYFCDTYDSKPYSTK
uniref:Uncharacterized protein n=1 Tax=Romanomermis culicivorax TaxID=13658 RepID=A0A915KNN2_ROMCU